MWPFSREPIEAARRLAEERAEKEKKDAEAEHFLSSMKKEKYEVPPYIVPPEVPAVGPRGFEGPVGPTGPKGEPGPRGLHATEEEDAVGVVGSVYGVPVSDIHALRQLSLTTGISTSDLISVLEGAIDTIPSTMLQEMREL
ncbi:hypothetical protein [Vibrio phage VP41s3]|nr:hypothetical protein [Vibrio phage VP41s3]